MNKIKGKKCVNTGMKLNMWKKMNGIKDGVPTIRMIRDSYTHPYCFNADIIKHIDTKMKYMKWMVWIEFYESGRHILKIVGEGLCHIGKRLTVSRHQRRLQHVWHFQDLVVVTNWWGQGQLFGVGYKIDGVVVSEFDWKELHATEQRQPTGNRGLNEIY